LSPVPKTPLVCYVTDCTSLKAADWSLALRERIKTATEAGVDWVQIREKDLPARELLALARDASQIAANFCGAVKASAVCESALAITETRILVNDRLDVALAAGAAGVHLGRESLDVREVSAWCRRGNAPPGFLIGVSCHNLKEAQAAERDGASYIFFGPVFDTPSKRTFGEPQGIQPLTEISTSVDIPVIAIGGIDESNAVECLQAGAAGVAAIRMFQKTLNARELKNGLDRIRRHIL
jgi:thiamine-phosphate pyrophosphorylase